MLLWEAFDLFTVLAGEWKYREVWQITKVAVNSWQVKDKSKGVITLQSGGELINH